MGKSQYGSERSPPVRRIAVCPNGPIARRQNARFLPWLISAAALLAMALLGRVLLGQPSLVTRFWYAVNESGNIGSISVYDMDNGHTLVKTIQTVSGISDPRGVVANATTGKLYVTYSPGHVFCLDLKTDKVLWDQGYSPNVDRLAISPDGSTLYIPTNENTADANYISIVNAADGSLVRTVTVDYRTHDAQYPLSGPLFQECKASTCNYLYMIDPRSYNVTKFGPFRGILAPYVVNSDSSYVAVTEVDWWGIQIGNLKTGKIYTAVPPNAPAEGESHGIGMRPDEQEVWQSGPNPDPHEYVWNISDPRNPKLTHTLSLPSTTHWMTFSIAGDYAYIAPGKLSSVPTQVYNTATYKVAATIGASEDMLEVDIDTFNREVTAVGDQYGIGRRR